MKQNANNISQSNRFARFVFLSIAFLFVLSATVSFAILHHEDDLKISWDSYSLINQHNKVVTSETFQGKWLVVYFGFTQCTNVCPVQMSNITNAIHTFRKISPDKVIAPVLISVDPDQDTPEKMKAYLTYFNVPVIGLTGTMNQLKLISRKFKTYFEKESNDSKEILHSNVIYFVSPDGEIIEKTVGNQSSEQLLSKLTTVLDT
jgi:Uncharacterized protein SCO1/SenC/PrrC, involved in biogenesis of respiratory and photosynthetic systems